MKFLIGLLLGLLIISTQVFAASERLIIDAKNFETDDSKGITIFTGDVKLRKAKDKLNSNKLQIFMKPNSKGKDRQPLKYIATGNADFEIHSNGKVYIGKGNKVTYVPLKQEYTVEGNGYLKEITEDRELFGEKILINQLSGNAKVSGSKDKPVRFIINIDNDEDKK